MNFVLVHMRAFLFFENYAKAHSNFSIQRCRELQLFASLMTYEKAILSSSLAKA